MRRKGVTFDSKVVKVVTSDGIDVTHGGTVYIPREMYPQWYQIFLTNYRNHCKEVGKPCAI
jgi:hypothetical protein